MRLSIFWTHDILDFIVLFQRRENYLSTAGTLFIARNSLPDIFAVWFMKFMEIRKVSSVLWMEEFMSSVCSWEIATGNLMAWISFVSMLISNV